MADDPDDVQRTAAYGAERYLVRQIPLAALLLLLAVAALVWSDRLSWQGAYLATALVMASGGFIVFATLRHFGPAPPRLVLSSDGIRQRLSHGRILFIPWDEVQGVQSRDHKTMTVAGIWQTTRDVPAVLVSRRFYDRAMPAQPWLRRPLNWGHIAQPTNGTVRILFRHDYLGTRPQALRQAIETRWRAFSRHPDAGLPPREEARPVRWVPDRLLPWMPAIVLLGLFAVAYVLWPTHELSDATRAAYLGELLDRGGVAARLADGRMARLYRRDVAAAATPQCEIARSKAAFWKPSLISGASCTAALTLRSGGEAMAAFALATKTFTVEYKLGHFREGSALVAAALGLEEVDALLCRRGHCGPRAQAR